MTADTESGRRRVSANSERREVGIGEGRGEEGVDQSRVRVRWTKARTAFERAFTSLGG